MRELKESYDIMIGYLYEINSYHLDFIKYLSKKCPDNVYPELINIYSYINMTNSKLIYTITTNYNSYYFQNNKFRKKQIHNNIFNDLYIYPFNNIYDLFFILERIELNIIQFFEDSFKSFTYNDFKKMLNIIIAQKYSSINDIKVILSA